MNRYRTVASNYTALIQLALDFVRNRSSLMHKPCQLVLFESFARQVQLPITPAFASQSIPKFETSDAKRRRLEQATDQDRKTPKIPADVLVQHMMDSVGT